MPELIKSQTIGKNVVAEVSTLANGEKRAEYKTLLWVFGTRKVKPGQYESIETILFDEGIVDEYRVEVEFDPGKGVKSSVAKEIRDKL